MATFDDAKARRLAAHLDLRHPAAAAVAAAPASPAKGKGKEKAVVARDESLRAAASKLGKAKEAALAQVKDDVAALRATEGFRDRPPDNAEDHRLAILRLQLSRLRAEAASFKLAATTVPPDSPIVNQPQVVGEIQARKSVARQVEEHRKAAEVDKELIAEAEAELAMAKRLRTEAAELKQGMEQRLAELRAQKDRSPGDLVSEARQRVKTLEASGSLMQGQLVDFIDRLAIEDDSDDEAGGEPKDELRSIRVFFKPPRRKKSDIGADAKAHQLKSLLERLMNFSVTSPGDPWIEVSTSTSHDGATEDEDDEEDEDARRISVSQALVDWVVGAGIAVQHPNDARRVKLVEFGRQVGAEREEPL